MQGIISVVTVGKDFDEYAPHRIISNHEDASEDTQAHLQHPMLVKENRCCGCDGSEGEQQEKSPGRVVARPVGADEAQVIKIRYGDTVLME